MNKGSRWTFVSSLETNVFPARSFDLPLQWWCHQAAQCSEKTTSDGSRCQVWHGKCTPAHVTHGLLIAWSHFVQVLQFFIPKLTIYIESEISATLTASFFSFIFNCVSLLHHCSLFMHLHTARQWLRSKHKLLYLHKIKTEPQLYNK